MLEPRGIITSESPENNVKHCAIKKHYAGINTKVSTTTIRKTVW